MDYVSQILPLLLEGAWISVKLFALTLVLALPLGLPFALGENSRILPIKWICKLYIFVFRGTPLMLQLFFFYFFFPIELGVDLDAFPTSVLTFVLNYAAYFAEIYRGGINSIDKGQYEAAHSLGLTKSQTTFGIVIPQMMKVVLPPISNEAIVLIKDTALASVISLAEMMKVSEGMVNRDGTLIPYVLAAVIYLCMTFLLSVAIHYIEKHYSKYDRKEE
jgi:polar amino acid transport system permease protein